MTEENKKKNKMIGIGLGILIVLLVVISSTYAYWQITKSQEDVNKMVAACLSLDVTFDGGITMENEYPIEKYTAMRDLAGYTFTIQNKCQTPVNYIIGLESVKDEEISAYMDSSAIALAIDDAFLGTYDTLGDLTGPTEGARASKELKTATIAANSTNTHNLKIWIDENASIENQSKAFLGRVFITGGQGVENDNPQITATSGECFDIDENGEILGYDESCGTSVTIPASVDGIAVRTIDTDAFRETTTTYNYDFVTVADSNWAPQRAYITDHSQEEEVIAWANANGFGSVEMNLYTETPTLADGEMLLYCNMSEDIDNMCVPAAGNELTTTETKISIIGLDLSQALYLERIEKAAFSNVDASLVSEDNIDSFANYPISLTSLTFGDDANQLLIEDKAFARIDVDNLTLYSSDVSPVYQDGEFITPHAYGGANIDNLVIKINTENSVLGTFGSLDVPEDMVAHWYGGITANKVTLEEGIEDINVSIFHDATVNEFILPNSYIKKAEHTNGLIFVAIGTLILPNEITEIPASLFSSVDVDNITIPYTVETIGEQAFENATIGNIVFEDTTTNPSQLKAINYQAFMGLKGASEITLPSSLETIGEEAFGSITTTTKVTIPASVTSIGDSAFNNSYNLTEVVFEDTTTNPSQLKSIGYRAFYYTPKVSNVTLPTSITSIGGEAFANAGSGILTVPMTQETFTNTVTTGLRWSGSYTVSYSS